MIYFETWKKSFTFDGRSNRTEYWVFTLANYLILYSILELKYARIFPAKILTIIFLGFLVLKFIPGLAVACRRLTDSGRRSSDIIWFFIPAMGPFIIHTLCLLPTEVEDMDES